MPVKRVVNLSENFSPPPTFSGIEVDVSTALGSDDIPTWFGISNLIVVP